MKILNLPGVGDTFNTFELAEEHLLASTFPITGFALINRRSGSSTTFYCMSGRMKSDKDKVSKCDFKVKIVEDQGTHRCTVIEIEAEHNHDMSPKSKLNSRYLPSSVGTLAKVMKRIHAEEDLKNSQEVSRAHSGSMQGHPSERDETPRSPSVGRDEVKVAPEKRRREEEVEPEEALEHRRELPKKTGVGFAVDSDDEGGTPSPKSDSSLENFLRSLSSTFDLSQYAPLFRTPEIGIDTSDQLLDVAGGNLKGLLDELKLGFGPKEALRKGLQKKLKQ